MRRTIISLGGSLIYPKEIDSSFLKNFKLLIEEKVSKGHSFAIFCGGGKLARDYQNAASSVAHLSDEQKDWLGIEATKLNAFLLKSVFEEKSVYEKVINNPTQKISTDKPIIICSGWKPGWSTDYDAILLAKSLNASTIINMSDIDYVYDTDPKKSKDARPLKKISWKEFRKLVGNEWKPGLNMPFDPIAAKEAEKAKCTVFIIGKNLFNLSSLLEGKEFRGTTVS